LEHVREKLAAGPAGLYAVFLHVVEIARAIGATICASGRLSVVLGLENKSRKKRRKIDGISKPTYLCPVQFQNQVSPSFRPARIFAHLSRIPSVFFPHFRSRCLMGVTVGRSFGSLLIFFVTPIALLPSLRVLSYADPTVFAALTF
jgi:hypothetical protein